MKLLNKISVVLLVSHVVIVCLLSAWSYCDIYSLPASRYFKLSILFGLPRVAGNMLESILYMQSILFFIVVAFIFSFCNIKNGGERLICHIILSSFQVVALGPLLS